MAKPLARIAALVERYGIIARMQINSRTNIARVDLFCEKERGLPIVASLFAEGWKPAGEYEMPNDLFGFRLSHEEKTAERAQATREILIGYNTIAGPNGLNWDELPLKLP